MDADPPPDTPPSGEVLGPYRLDRLVGRGGMGEVHRAWDDRRRRWVALKLLDRWTAHDPAFRRRFRREAEIAARLTDPHVLPVHDFGDVDGRLFLDMRLVAGPDLARVLAEGPLPRARALDLLRQVAGALDAAHAEGLVHRDVKPSNVLVAPGDFAYVVDFGLAHDQGAVSSDDPAEVLGTLGYLAPERLRGEVADRRADVYSLACVVFECLTGRRPHDGDDPAAVIAGHLHRPPPRASDVEPSLPSAVDAVLARGLATDPADRYPEAGALVRAVSDALAAGGASAGAGGASAGAGGADGADGAGGPGLAGVDDRTRRTPPPTRVEAAADPAVSRRPGRTATVVGAVLVAALLAVIGVVAVRGYVGEGLSVGLSPIAVAPARDGGRVLVVGGGATAVTVVDTGRDTVVRRVPIDGRAVGATQAGDRLDVVTIGGRVDPALVTLDTRTATVVGVARLPAPPGGPPAAGPDGTRVAVPVRTAVQVVDPAGALLATADRPARAVAFAPDGRRLYTLDGRSTAVGVAATADGRGLGAVGLDGVAEELRTSPDGRVLAVTDDSPALTLVDTGTDRVVTRVRLPGRPSGLAFTPDGGRVLVGTDQPGTPPPGGTPPGALDAAAREGPAVVAVDPVAGRVVASYRREPYASTVALAVSPDGARLYVANTDLGTLTIDRLRR